MTKEEVLKKCKVDGLIVKLPDIQLDRKLYMDVAKDITLIGGKWKGGKVYGFVFKSDPTKLLKELSISKVNLKKEFQFFATPSDLAKELVYLADVKQHDTILEPSAGQGAIIQEINNVCDVKVDCYEIMDVNRIILEESNLNFSLIGKDFLKSNNVCYSKIIANPPFSKNQDIDHIMHMYECLGRGGLLVSIASKHWEKSNNKKERKFRDWLEFKNAEIINIDAGTFKESGTNIACNIIIIEKQL